MAYVDPPFNLVATNVSSTTNSLVWENGTTYDEITIYRNNVFLKNVSDSATSTTDATISINVNYEYKLRGTVTGVGTSDWCTPDSAAYWTVSATDTANVSDTHTLAVAFVISATETVNTQDAYSLEYTEGGEPPGGNEYEITETDTVNVSDGYELSVMGAQGSMYYLTASDGNIYPYSDDYTSDNDATINAYWESRRIDFSDMFPQYAHTWKTIDRVILTYVDKAQANISVSLSRDGGTTWTDNYRVIGSGTNQVKEATYHYVGQTGRFFSFKIRNSSTTETFQWVRLTVYFEPHGEFFHTDD
jgi:hypothetical protein